MLVHTHTRSMCTWKVGIDGTAGIDVAGAGILFLIPVPKNRVCKMKSHGLIFDVLEVWEGLLVIKLSRCHPCNFFFGCRNRTHGTCTTGNHVRFRGCLKYGR